MRSRPEVLSSILRYLDSFILLLPVPKRSSWIQCVFPFVWTCFETALCRAGWLAVGGRDLVRNVTLLTESKPAVAGEPRKLCDDTSSLSRCFAEFGDMVELGRAVHLSRQVVMLHPDSATALRIYAKALLCRFEHKGSHDDLDEAVSSFQAALRPGRAMYPDYWECKSDLGSALMYRVLEKSDPADLTDAVAHCRDAADFILLPDDPYRADVLTNLGIALRTRYTQKGGIHDLTEAIACHQQALDLHQGGHPRRPDSLTNLGISLVVRYQRERRPEDMDTAVASFQEALHQQPHHHPRRDNTLHALATALLSRCHDEPGNGDMKRAATLLREALLSRQPGHPRRSDTLNNLAVTLRTSFDEKADFIALDEAIAVDREALTLRPPGHPNRASTLDNLSGSLCGRYHYQGDAQDLGEGISLARESLCLRPLSHPRRCASLTKVALLLLKLFRRDRDPSHLNAAMAYNLEALEIGGWDEIYEVRAYALTLRATYYHDGSITHLDKAISTARRAAELSGPTHRGHADSLDILADLLRARFHRQGDSSDLIAAIASHREALDTCNPESLNRFWLLHNFSKALWVLYEQTGDVLELEEAISLSRAALEMCSPGHEGRSEALNHLGQLLRTRSEQRGEVADLADSISCHREAVTIYSRGHHLNSESLHHLAASLSIRFTKTRNLSDIKEAIATHRQSVHLCPPHDPNRSERLRRLANSLAEWVRYGYGRASSLQNCKSSDEAHDQFEVISLLKEAANAEASPIVDRLRSSIDWVKVSRSFRHTSTLDAFVQTLALSEISVARGRSLETKLFHLTADRGAGRAEWMAVDAASCAFELGRTELGVELLEQGRATLFALLSRYRMSLDQLNELDEDLADEFMRLSWQLDSSAVSNGIVPGDTEAQDRYEDDVSRYRKISAKWERVVEQIRTLDGFHSFLRPIPFTELQKAAAFGPVIIVNVGTDRSDAVVVCSKGPPHLIPLPDATPMIIQQLSEELAVSLAEGDLRNSTVSTLRKVWKTVVGPIVEVLQGTFNVPRGSRIWWCPTSTASALPLHAAGTYCRGGLNLPDYYISSYTPTLGALLRARRKTLFDECPSMPSILVVGQTDTPSQPTLPAVITELRRTMESIPHATVLDGDHATRAAALNGIAQHSWVHFACHGHQDVERPFRSHFSLYDQPLHLIDIVERGLPHAELAVLSACHSAAGSRTTPDEILHLAAAMQFAGFRSVVGTMWAMADEDGPVVAEEFYKEILGRREGSAHYTNAAEALSKAVKVLRERRVPAWRWVNFVHFGA